MKPIIFFLGVALLATACRKDKPAQPAPEPVVKEVTFGVYTVHNYGGSSQYGYKSASVKLSLEKHVKNGSHIQVWDTTFVYRKLTEFPQQPQQYRVQKSIPVLENKEQLYVKYEVLYGSLYNEPQQSGFGRLLNDGENSLNVNVEL